MNKIIKAALAAKFQTNDVDAILEVINNTPNPEMATEILLGVFEPIQLPNVVDNNGVIYTLVEASWWQREVTYYYEKKKTLSAYFPKGTKQQDVTVENFKSLQVEGERDVYIRIETSETELVQSTCPILTWVGYKIV